MSFFFYNSPLDPQWKNDMNKLPVDGMGLDHTEQEAKIAIAETAISIELSKLDTIIAHVLKSGNLGSDGPEVRGKTGINFQFISPQSFVPLRVADFLIIAITWMI